MTEPQRYLIALGSNVRHQRHGPPPAVLQAALDALAGEGIEVLRASGIHCTAPMGHSRRRFANAAAIVQTRLAPGELLERLQHTERRFGRKRGGRRWRARVLDIDIVLWSGGICAERDVAVPHPAFRDRDFVLLPAAQIAHDWRDPLTGLTVQHLLARLTRRNPPPR